MNQRRSAPLEGNAPDIDSFFEQEGTMYEVETEAIQRVTARQLDIAAFTDANEGIRQGLEDAENGKLRPAREFFAEFEALHPELQ
jgi:hypothetical protein